MESGDAANIRTGTRLHETQMAMVGKHPFMDGLSSHPAVTVNPMPKRVPLPSAGAVYIVLPQRRKRPLSPTGVCVLCCTGGLRPGFIRGDGTTGA